MSDNIEDVETTISLLRSIDRSLKQMIPQPSIKVLKSDTGSVSGWTYLRIGKDYFYQKLVTYDGNANTQNLDFPVAIQFNRIEQIWNDATTKDFQVRVYPDPSRTDYMVLDTQTGNTATSRMSYFGYKYPGGTRIQIYSGTNTNAKTVTIRIQVTEL